MNSASDHSNKAHRIAILGGGASGFFAAIACAEANPEAEVHIFEQSSQCLTKVAKSGGGRCNVTHACFEPRRLSEHFPRGERALIGAFHKFHAEHAVEWFEARGVRLKRESDGRMFPQSDTSASVVQCLLESARAAGVHVHVRSAVSEVVFRNGLFSFSTNGEAISCECVLLATGGSRVPSGALIAASLGHVPIPPVPSLFTFDTPAKWIHELAGLSCRAEAFIPETPLRETGPILFTHRGLSGPAILRLSAWGARELAARKDCFSLRLNFLPGHSPQQVENLLQKQREEQPGKKIVNSPIASLPSRLWECLCASVPSDVRWTTLSRSHRMGLISALVSTQVQIVGKSLNKDEFVTCGGISCAEVDFRTMQSRIQPGLYFAGEILDVDGITGGFNFQSAWTTGWIAGHAMSGLASKVA